MLKLHKQYSGQWWYDEAHSVFASLLAFLMVDGSMQLLAIYNGDLSKESLMALGVIVIRSFVKVILEKVGFSPRRSS